MAPNRPTSREPHAAPEIRRVQERFERLLEASIAISRERSLSGLLQGIADAARSVVDARYAALGVIGPDGASLTAFHTSGIDEQAAAHIGRLPAGKGLLGLVIREGRPIRVSGVAAHPQAAGFPPHHPPMDTFLGVPIVGPDRVYGNLYLAEKRGGGAFTDEDERVAVLLAAQAAAAITNAQLNEEQNELLQRLEHMQRQRDQFFAMINHELRNALTGVYGWAEQLHRARSEAAVERAGREVYESAERTITLMNNLLDLSRLDAGRIQPVFRAIEPATVIRRAMASLEPAAAARRIALKDEYVDAPERLTTDPLRLEQILINLLSNAVRHGPAGEPIIVRAEAVNDAVFVHVMDRGRGIPREDHERIFEPYVRVDPESGLGSGLGLPVSRRMAELIGGRLTVASDLGRGATFTITLPLAPADRAPGH